MVKALFPEVDLPKALQELIELNRQLRLQMEEVQTRLIRIEDHQTIADERMSRMEDRHTRMEGDMARLKGDGYEDKVNRKVDSIFGVRLRRGHDGRNEISQHLAEAEEYEQVLAADLLWSGLLKQSNEPLTLVVESLWLAEQNDIARAVSRAAILSKTGVRALPVVAAQEWPPNTQRTARDKKVVIIQEFSLDRNSWEVAVSG